MAITGIEYGQVAWNVTSGCSPVSEGCLNCWAEPMAKRQAGRNGYSKDNPFKVTLHCNRLSEPMGWKKPRLALVSFMGDLFHNNVPDKYLDKVFSIILGCAVLNNRPHTFMTLTKRPERMRRYLTERQPVDLLKTWADIADGFIKLDDPDRVFSESVFSATCRDWDKNGRNSSGSEYRPWGYLSQVWPLPNLWAGVTAENQARADERVPILLHTPAVKRFVSIEPMLGPVDLYGGDPDPRLGGVVAGPGLSLEQYWNPDGSGPFPGIDWVICGGESGPGARPIHPDWVRSLRDQCRAAQVPFFFKQWGEYAEDPHTYGGERPERANQLVKQCIVASTNKSQIGKEEWTAYDSEGNPTYMKRVGKKQAGRLLDGREWLQMPEVL